MTADFEQEVQNSRILIADDNEQNLELMQAYLDDLGATIVTATDGEETLEVATADPPPDVILLDIMMPKMSGYEICRKLKSNPETESIPICMVTALHELGDIERAVDAGTDDFLSKPVNKWELITRVKSLLRVRHLQTELDRTLAYLAEVDRSGRSGPSGGGD